MLVALCGFGALAASAAQAQEAVIVERLPKRNLNDGYDHYYNRHRTRRAYIVEDYRPARRPAFIDERGRYYRVVEGRPVFTDRYDDGCPPRHFRRGDGEGY